MTRKFSAYLLASGCVDHKKKNQTFNYKIHTNIVNNKTSHNCNTNTTQTFVSLHHNHFTLFIYRTLNSILVITWPDNVHIGQAQQHNYKRYLQPVYMKLKQIFDSLNSWQIKPLLPPLKINAHFREDRRFVRDRVAAPILQFCHVFFDPLMPLYDLRSVFKSVLGVFNVGSF